MLSSSSVYLRLALFTMPFSLHGIAFDKDQFTEFVDLLGLTEEIETVTEERMADTTRKLFKQMLGIRAEKAQQAENDAGDARRALVREQEMVHNLRKISRRNTALVSIQHSLALQKQPKDRDETQANYQATLQDLYEQVGDKISSSVSLSKQVHHLQSSLESAEVEILETEQQLQRAKGEWDAAAKKFLIATLKPCDNVEEIQQSLAAAADAKEAQKRTNTEIEGLRKRLSDQTASRASLSNDLLELQSTLHDQDVEIIKMQLQVRNVEGERDAMADKLAMAELTVKFAKLSLGQKRHDTNEQLRDLERERDGTTAKIGQSENEPEQARELSKSHSKTAESAKLLALMLLLCYAAYYTGLTLR